MALKKKVRKARKQSRANSSKKSVKQPRAKSLQKVKKRKYTRRARKVAADLPNLPAILKKNGLPNALKDIPPRMLMLNEAAQVVGVDQTSRLGDPIFAFSGIAALKRAFWNNVHPVAGTAEAGEVGDARYQNSNTGHSIDMILMSLGKLATAPNNTIKRDTLLDLVSYTAILYETAAAQGQLSAE